MSYNTNQPPSNQTPQEAVVNKTQLELNVDDKSSCSKTDANDRDNSVQLYYGVFIPPESNKRRELFVYKDSAEAINFCRLHKHARFKRFSNETDARYFSQYGSTPRQLTIIKSNNVQQQQQIQEKSLFKTPKIQEMAKFRKVIEVDNIEIFKSYVRENPRYLISSGDTPSILQEGPRYNALHIAARFNAPKIASYILNMIATSELTNRTFGTNEIGVDTDPRAKVLLDLYLNTPDRSLNETPLHFASKIGAVAVIEILLMYRQCLRKTYNKHGNTPLDVVCTRASGEALNNKESIEFLLREDHFYVPVLRTNDNSVQARVGNPITRTGVLDSLPTTSKESELHPSAKVHALAGPMPKEEALLFQKQWKKTLLSSDCDLKPSRLDAEKGLERIGRDLTVQFHVQWTEYWSFLDAFLDLSSVEGLDLLEAYLKDKFFDTVAAWHSPKKVPENSKFSTEHLSSISDCCAHFKSLHKSGGNSPETVDMTVMCFEKFLEVFARRISTSLIRPHQIVHEISHLETFLTNCSLDRRFNSIDLTKVHYRLSQIVEKNLKNIWNSEELTSTLTTLIELNDSNESDADSGIVRKALVCIASFLLENLASHSSRSSPNNEPLQNLWLHSKCCGCQLLPASRATTRRRFQFDEDDYLKTPTNNIYSKVDISNLHETKSCDTELVYLQCSSISSSQIDLDNDNDSYYIAPTSPFLEETQYYDCFDVGDIFLAGELPTKLDASVLHALKDVTIITPNSYPFIYYWKKTCENRAMLEDSSKWPVPRLSSSPNKMIKEVFSQSWHR